MATEFQKKVWAEIDKIPYGSTITYKEIAIKIGKPNAASLSEVARQLRLLSGLYDQAARSASGF